MNPQEIVIFSYNAINIPIEKGFASSQLTIVEGLPPERFLFLSVILEEPFANASA